jgi:prepilin-type N-terminal cleavage/methylation domain-containing protein
MKKTNNKGFSLVELIIVIAIMAILIGVLAPQYIKYVEKSRVSADTDVLDSVYSAVNTAASDPDVVATDIPEAAFTEVGDDTFGTAVQEILGTNIEGCAGKLKSKSTDGTITVNVDANGNFSVVSGDITVPSVIGE